MRLERQDNTMIKKYTRKNFLLQWSMSGMIILNHNPRAPISRVDVPANIKKKSLKLSTLHYLPENG